MWGLTARVTPFISTRLWALLEDHWGLCCSAQRNSNSLERTDRFLGGNKENKLFLHCQLPCPRRPFFRDLLPDVSCLFGSSHTSGLPVRAPHYCTCSVTKLPFTRYRECYFITHHAGAHSDPVLPSNGSTIPSFLPTSCLPSSFQQRAPILGTWEKKTKDRPKACRRP